MDSQKLKFMMSIQSEIDKLQDKHGSENLIIKDLKNQFEILSQFEIEKDNLKNTNGQELLPIKIDTEAIRSHLEIRANVSIDFNFINLDRVRTQLMKDNLRMENSRLDVGLKNETERFYNFCVNAFYQIEELINYYFAKKYSFEDFIKVITSKNNGKIFNQKQLSEITIAEKIFVFEGLFYYNQIDSNGKVVHYESSINLIREVRNEDLHRCSVIEEDNDQVIERFRQILKKIFDFNKNKIQARDYYKKNQYEKLIEKRAKLINFIKDKNYNLVRDTIQALVFKIKSELHK